MPRALSTRAPDLDDFFAREADPLEAGDSSVMTIVEVVYYDVACVDGGWGLGESWPKLRTFYIILAHCK